MTTSVNGDKSPPTSLEPIRGLILLYMYEVSHRGRRGVDKAFRTLLEDKRDTIATQWREIALSAYSPEASRFMTTEKDPFSNPVGHTFSRVIDELLNQIIAGANDDDLNTLVMDVMKIRAVQELAPSTACGFIMALKKVVRDVLGTSALEGDGLQSYYILESHIDHMALRAFDAYVVSREKIFEIKANELRRRSERVITKLNERLFARASEPESSERGGTR